VLFRVVRALLTNVVKHARCERAKVTLGRADVYVTVSVEDAGVGIEGPPGAAPPDGFGLFSVREQVSRLGGTFELVSSTGAGARVTLRVPSNPLNAPALEAVRS